MHITRAPMPVVIGAPRSGTTLLRLMLDAHRDLAIPPETGFLVLDHASDPSSDFDPSTNFDPVTDDGDECRRQSFFDALTHFPADAPAWKDFGIPEDSFRTALDAVVPFTIVDGYRAFYRTYAARFGKRRWGDKTPLYCLHIDRIASLLPEAHFIHLIRDGRDVALSLRQMWFAPGRDIETLAAHWRCCVETARASARRLAQSQSACGGPHRYLEVRFEDLIHDASRVLRDICAFVDLDRASIPQMQCYHTRASSRLAEHRERIRSDGSLVVSHEARLQQQALTMRPPQESRVEAWRWSMSRDEQRRFEAVAGGLLGGLGYSTSFSAPAAQRTG